MNSRAVKDYFRAFKLKQFVAFESVMLYIYLLIGPMYFVEPLIDGGGDAALMIYYCGMITLLFALVGMRLNPVGLPKLLFLCPMSREQREEYVRTRFWARSLVPASLFVVGRAILWIVFPVQTFYLLTDMILLFGILGASFTTLTGNVKALEATKDQPKLLREKEIKGVDSKGLLAFLIGMLTWFFACSGIADNGKVHIVVWIDTVLLLIWQISLAVKMVGRVKYLIPLASDYERMNV